jgi:hypothetical protein
MRGEAAQFFLKLREATGEADLAFLGQRSNRLCTQHLATTRGDLLERHIGLGGLDDELDHLAAVVRLANDLVGQDADQRPKSIPAPMSSGLP